MVHWRGIKLRYKQKSVLMLFFYGGRFAFKDFPRTRNLSKAEQILGVSLESEGSENNSADELEKKSRSKVEKLLGVSLSPNKKKKEVRRSQTSREIKVDLLV